MRIIHALAAEPPGDPGRFLGVLDKEIAVPSADLALLAGLDQHAAAVRDALGPGAGRLDLGDLAAYARGVVTVATGWDWPDVPAAAELWLRLRLASVCDLARACGHQPAAV